MREDGSRWGVAIAVTVLGVAAVCAPTTRAALTEKQARAYTDIRKNYFVVLALPARTGEVRKEHRQYLRAIDEFLASLGPEDGAYRAAALFYRGRLRLHLRDWRDARKDLDACLASLPADVHADIPSGLPSVVSIHISRALTFAGDGPVAVLEELEKVPADLPKPRLHEVGEVVAELAARFEREEKFAEAVRVLEVIKRFDLWEDEADNPQKKIDLFRLAMSGGMAAPQQPAATQER